MRRNLGTVGLAALLAVAPISLSQSEVGLSDGWAASGSTNASHLTSDKPKSYTNGSEIMFCNASDEPVRATIAPGASVPGERLLWPGNCIFVWGSALQVTNEGSSVATVTATTLGRPGGWRGHKGFR
jgi:hypothetical protein